MESTGRQVYLRSLLKDSSESLYIHHPLIINLKSGLKLSKAEKATPISDFRKSKQKASWVLGEAAFLVGLISKLRELSYSDLKDLFNY